jgi:hypothetical protein
VSLAGSLDSISSSHGLIREVLSTLEVSREVVAGDVAAKEEVSNEVFPTEKLSRFSFSVGHLEKSLGDGLLTIVVAADGKDSSRSIPIMGGSGSVSNDIVTDSDTLGELI